MWLLECTLHRPYSSCFHCLGTLPRICRVRKPYQPFGERDPAEDNRTTPANQHPLSSTLVRLSYTVQTDWPSCHVDPWGRPGGKRAGALPRQAKASWEMGVVYFKSWHVGMVCYTSTDNWWETQIEQNEKWRPASRFGSFQCPGVLILGKA